MWRPRLGFGGSMSKPNAQVDKLRAPRKPRRCPICKHYPLASILYGMPAYDKKMQRDIDEYRLVLGSCMIGEVDSSLRKNTSFSRPSQAKARYNMYR